MAGVLFWFVIMVIDSRESNPKDEINALFYELGARPIAYHVIFAKITGSVTGGVLLSQLIYWWKAVHCREFYKTDKELVGETGMGLWELKGAKKHVAPFVIIERKGVPARTYYQIDINAIIPAITTCWKNQQQEVRKTNNYQYREYYRDYSIRSAKRCNDRFPHRCF